MMMVMMTIPPLSPAWTVEDSAFAFLLVCYLSDRHGCIPVALLMAWHTLHNTTSNTVTQSTSRVQDHFPFMLLCLFDRARRVFVVYCIDRRIMFPAHHTVTPKGSHHFTVEVRFLSTESPG
jgi:hypothetical protein